MTGLTICGIGKNTSKFLGPKLQAKIDAMIVPIIAPIQNSDTNSEASEIDSGPDFNGVSSDVNNIKFAPAYPHIMP